MIRLKEIREEKGIKQKELAKGVGVTCAYLCAVERNRKQLSLKRAVEIANFLNVSLNELVGRQDGQAETHKNY